LLLVLLRLELLHMSLGALVYGRVLLGLSHGVESRIASLGQGSWVNASCVHSRHGGKTDPGAGIHTHHVHVHVHVHPTTHSVHRAIHHAVVLLLLLEKLGGINAAGVHGVGIHGVHVHVHARPHELRGVDGATTKGVWGELGLLLLLLGTNGAVLEASSEHGWVDSAGIGVRACEGL
jgi:hypothetical protein